jgi:hypothetical protein
MQHPAIIYSTVVNTHTHLDRSGIFRYYRGPCIDTCIDSIIDLYQRVMRSVHTVECVYTLDEFCSVYTVY